MKLKLPLNKCIITQHYGQNLVDYSRFGLKGHDGIDFECASGTPVLAVADGTIFKLNLSNDGYGLYIRQHIQDGDKKIEVVYGHLKEYKVSEGQQVKAGDIIALADNTGYSTGSHLHLGVRYKDNQGNVIDQSNGYAGYVDPYPLFDDKISWTNYWHWKNLTGQTIPEYEQIPLKSHYNAITSENLYETMQRLSYKAWIYLFSRLCRFPTYDELIALSIGRWDFEAVYRNRVGKWYKYYTKDQYLNRIKDGIGL